MDQYRHVVFAGARSSSSVSIERGHKPLRQAPSPSLFAPPFAPHPPFISPADRLLLEEVFRHYQLNITIYRPTALGRRVPACLRALQARSPAEALRRLEQDTASAELALNAVLIGVTCFFRDAPVFSHLQATALPGLLRSSPAPRVLSVGCSDGSELYSLAISLQESGARDLCLHGMDCRRCAVERARAGVYAACALDALPPPLREKYFDRDRRGYRAKEFLRCSAHWHLADAFLGLPAGPFDLIACRNLAIYLEPAAAARLWRRLHCALRPGGLLLTGKAERPTSGFLRAGPCLFRKALP